MNNSYLYLLHPTRVIACSGFGLSCPSAAYNVVSNESLIVWIKHYPDPNDDANTLRDIKAQRLSPTGELVGDEITIAHHTSTLFYLPDPSVAVAYSDAADEYLVVWDSGFSDGDWNIYARRVSRDGEPVSDPIHVATAGKKETHPTIAYGSENHEYLIVWEYGYSERDLDIYARRVSHDGKVIGSPIYVATSGKKETQPVVAYNSQNNEYLIVWEYGYSDTNWDVYARRVDGVGQLVGSQIYLATHSHNETYPAIAYNHRDNEYLIVWEYSVSDTNLDIQGCWLDGSGQLINSKTYGIGSILGRNEIHPAIAYNGYDNEYLVVWAHSSPGDDFDIYAHCIDSDGRTIGDVIPISLSLEENEDQPCVVSAGAGNQYSVIWRSHRPGSSQIKGRFVKGPKLAVRPPELDFGQVQLGQVKTQTVDIINVGTSPLKVSIPAPSHQGSFHWRAIKHWILHPGERREYDIRFLPLQAGRCTQTLFVESHTPEGSQSIPLSGLGTGTIPK